MGGVYVTGSYTYAPVFGNSNINEDNKFFFAKFNDSGSLAWSKMEDANSSWTQPHNQGAPQQWMGNKLLCDPISSDIYLTFATSGQSIFGDYELDNASIGAYIVKYDSNGTVIWAQQTNSFGDSKVHGIGKMPNGNLRLFGAFENEMWMGWDTISTPNSNDDMFMAELFDCPPGNATITREADTLTASAGAFYLWFENGNPMSWETEQTFVPSWDGNYSVQVFDNSFCRYTSDVYPFVLCPTIPFNITNSNDTLYAINGTSYQWYENEIAIAGATNQYYVPQIDGTYYVEVIDNNLCSLTSFWYFFYGVDVEDYSQSLSMNIYPNPAKDILIVESNYQQPTTFTLFNALGQRLIQQELNDSDIFIALPADLSGLYYVQISNSSNSKILFSKKLMIQ